ncbi:MAG: hypothetical protein ACP5P3_07510 [Ignavibacteria bacterium]
MKNRVPVKWNLNNIISYFATILVLFTSLFIIIVYYYRDSNYTVEILKPANNGLISGDFSVELLVMGNADVLRIYIDDSLVERRALNIGPESAQASIQKILMTSKGLTEKKHIIRAELDRGLLSVKKVSEINIDYIKFERDTLSIRNQNLDKNLEMVFRDLIPDYYVVLDSLRRKYPVVWKYNPIYTGIKNKILDSTKYINIRTLFRKMFFALEENLDDEIYYIAHLINVELYKHSIPFWISFYNRISNNNYRTTFLLSYKIVRTMKVEIPNGEVEVLVITRLDKLNRVERFLGMQVPETPVPLVIEERIQEEANAIIDFINDRQNSIKEFRGLYYFSQPSYNLHLRQMVRRSLIDVFGKKPSKSIIEEFLTLSTAYHETNHYLNTITCVQMSSIIQDVLNYFVKKQKESSVESSTFKDPPRIRNLYYFASLANEEVSSYLYQISRSRELSKYLLYKMIDCMLKYDYNELGLHWIAKVVLFLIGNEYGFVTGDLLFKNYPENETQWLELAKKIIEQKPESIVEKTTQAFLKQFVIIQ